MSSLKTGAKPRAFIDSRCHSREGAGSGLGVAEREHPERAAVNATRAESERRFISLLNLIYYCRFSPRSISGPRGRRVAVSKEEKIPSSIVELSLPPPKRAWHELAARAAADLLGADLRAGLSSGEAARRLDLWGPNELIERGGRSAARILLEQFAARMILLLIVAAALSAAIGDFKDAVAIGAVVVLNALLGFSHEYQAERAMAALKALSSPTVRARRGGRAQRIPARDLAPGDLLLLEAGNVVAADARLLETAALKVAEAALTGEPEPVEKCVEPLSGASALGDRRNMVYKGTVVAHGRGLALVTETGMRTELGRIAELLESAGGGPTPLQRRLDRLGDRLAAAALVLVAVVFGLGMLRCEPLKEMFLTAVSLAAAAVPEGLPAVVTIALAIGARRMLARRALIRKLPAVEALG